VTLVTLAACGGDAPLSEREFRRRVDALCSDVADGIARVPQPATLDELSAGYFDIFPLLSDLSDGYEELSPPGELEEDADRLEARIDDVFSVYSNLRTAAELRELDDADEDIADGEDVIGRIDGLASRLEVEECRDAFGAEHLTNAAALVAAERQVQLPTGDFVTDANAACSRFVEDISDAGFPTDPVSYQLFVSTLRQAYELLGRDLEALPSPPGSEAQVAEFVDTIDEAVGALSQAASTTGSAGDEDIAALQEELAGLGGDLSAQASALGLDC